MNVTVSDVSLGHVSPAARSAIAGSELDAARATRYAVGAVVLSFLGNVVHLITKLDSFGDLFTSRGIAVTAEALFGPALVFICSHLLMHADRGRPMERFPLWAGFGAGALLSAVHLWAIAFGVLSTGVLADVHPGVPFVAAALLPVGVEGASIGSIQQAARFRSERDALTAEVIAAEAEREAAEERARRDADAKARRRVEVERAEAERVAAEVEAEERRIAAETERERQLLVDRQKAARAAKAARRNGAGGGSKVDTESDVAVFVAAHAGDRSGKGPTAKQIGEALGMSERNVLRTEAWKNRHATLTASSSPDSTGSGSEDPVDAVEVEGLSGLEVSGPGRLSELEVV